MQPGQLHVAIVGAGATGTELAAELHNATRALVAFGLDTIDPDKHIRLHLIEAAPRILPALPERISAAADQMLRGLDVQVRVGARVAEVMTDGLRLADGTEIKAEFVVWAAGVKGHPFVRDCGLQVNALNQILVRPTLQSMDDPQVFAMGDCAAVPWPGHEPRNVPPRAQAAHQQASHLYGSLRRVLAGREPRPWRYRDFGSLVSLGTYTTIGNLMANFSRGNIWLEGTFARWMYLSLYKLHEIALHGFWKTALATVGRMISSQTVPRVKLH